MAGGHRIGKSLPAFSRGAEFYDAVYADKDYRTECEFYARMFTVDSDIPVKKILDIGCGTGRHAIEFAKMGYSVLGIDRSEEMLKAARKRESNDILFAQADIRSFESDEKCGAAVAAFAVMSYQATNKDVSDALLSIRRSLRPGGVLVFDFWYGPAVLSLKPEKRLLRFKYGGGVLRRSVDSSLDVFNQCVTVHYDYESEEGPGKIEPFSEVHKVRFFFPQEICNFLEQAGFECLQLCPFPEEAKPLTENTWNATAAARAR